MMKPFRVPPELLALSQMQRATEPAQGVPLYLPAFANALLAEPQADDLVAEADFGVEAEDFASGFDEDDDFY